MELRSQFLKDGFLIVPLFATTLAICYDVGFFYGLNIAFFTFFSLTEHIVFALQAIPFALPTAFSVFGLIAISWYGVQKTKREVAEITERTKTMPPEELQTLLSKIRRKAKLIEAADPFMQGVFTVAVVYLIGIKYYTAAILTVVGMFVAKLIYPIEKLEQPNAKWTLIAFAVVAILVLAFAVGVERANLLVAGTKATERISVKGQEYEGLIVRGGERGLLFVDFQTKKPTFLRWDDIKRVDGI